MKAAVFKSPGVPMVVEEVNDPTPEEGQLVEEVVGSSSSWHNW